MAVIKTRGATRKLGPVSLGRKFIRFTTSSKDRHFAIHEDLICASSKLFKERLQKGRKKVEGECAICHEELDAKAGDLTFCKAECGQNIHEKCMTQWLAERGSAKTCPMCRKIWKVDGQESVALDHDLDTDAVQLYLDWLYTGKLQFEESMDRATDNFNIHLLKAFAVSDVMQDNTFKHFIIAEFFTGVESKVNKGFWTKSVRYAFGSAGTDSLREFVVDACLSDFRPSWFTTYRLSFPAAFLNALLAAALEALKAIKPTPRELLRKYTKGEYKIEAVNDHDRRHDEDLEFHEVLSRLCPP